MGYFNTIIRYFFFINGSFWSIFNITKNNEDLYAHSFNINSSDKIVSFIKLIGLPLNYIVFFYKNVVFSSFFQSSSSLFNSISLNTSILLINYKKNLFRSLTNYSISSNFSIMYGYIKSKQLNTDNLLFILPYNFFSIKNKQNNFINSYFLYFLRVYFFFTFFFKKLVSNLYNMVLIQIYSFGLNTVVSTFSASDLKKSSKYFPFFLSIFFFHFSIKYYRYYTL